MTSPRADGLPGDALLPGRRPPIRMTRPSLSAPLGVAALAAAVVAVALAPVAIASATTRTVRLEDSYFSASNLRVRPGDAVRFVWSGELEHNLTGRGVPRRYEDPAWRPKPLRVRFTRRGRFRYVCTIHTGMDMTVRVR